MSAGGGAAAARHAAAAAGGRGRARRQRRRQRPLAAALSAGRREGLPAAAAGGLSARTAGCSGRRHARVRAAASRPRSPVSLSPMFMRAAAARPDACGETALHMCCAKRIKRVL